MIFELMSYLGEKRLSIILQSIVVSEFDIWKMGFKKKKIESTSNQRIIERKTSIKISK